MLKIKSKEMNLSLLLMSQRATTDKTGNKNSSNN